MFIVFFLDLPPTKRGLLGCDPAFIRIKGASHGRAEATQFTQLSWAFLEDSRAEY